MENITYSPGKVTSRTLHDAITATVAYTSAKSEIVAGAKKIALQFTASATISDRSAVLKVYGTLDGTNWAQLNILVSNATPTAGNDLTRVASVTRNSAGNDMIFIDSEAVGALREIRADVAITDSTVPVGTITVVCNAQY
ncbi:MAG: hypothetical protein WC114_11625 [Smithellaceae bacterium]|jgi:hypothetical protein